MLSGATAEEHAFLYAVLYASVFDYPLTAAQIQETLPRVTATVADVEAWYAASEMLQASIDLREGYFFPRGRRELIALRRAREASSQRVLHELKQPLALVLRMPFVRMVALSGSLAYLNADREADLDLFVITTPGHVWGVTTTLLLLARVFGWRRRLCLNYVISEDALRVEPGDLFTANQIVHLRPLVGDAVYRKFLDANPFVREWYPNFRRRTAARDQHAGRMRRYFEWAIDHSVGSLYERFSQYSYTWHLRRRAHLWASSDQVRLDRECLKLHTSSHRHRVMMRVEASVRDRESVRPAATVRALAVR